MACHVPNKIFITDFRQVWFLGYWATQYEIHPPEEVDAVLYVSMSRARAVVLMHTQLSRCVHPHCARGHDRWRVRGLLLLRWELESYQYRPCKAYHFYPQQHAAVSCDNSMSLPHSNTSPTAGSTEPPPDVSSLGAPKTYR